MEVALINKEYIKRVKDLGGERGNRGWEYSILIPRYANIINGNDTAPTDKAFKPLKNPSEVL
jgi:hypothetical protein